MSHSVTEGGTTHLACEVPMENTMFLDNLIARARSGIAKRKDYNRTVNEIKSLTDRDLADMRASRSEMLYQVRQQFFG